MNKITLLGRITKDIEYKAAGSSGYSRFTVAVDRPKNKDGEKETDFIGCVAWGKTGEVIAQYFHKGSRILVEGSLRIGSFTNKEGNKVNTADVFVNGFEFIDSKSTNSSAMESFGKPAFDEDVPF